MHDDNFQLVSSTVSRLISAQYPKLSGLEVSILSNNGTGHHIFRIGDEFVGRFPRNKEAESTIEKEFTFGQKLGGAIPALSKPLFLGVPTEDYPHRWVLSKYIEGNIADFEAPQSLELVLDLANFIASLHKISTRSAPKARRGVDIQTVDAETVNAINQITEFSSSNLLAMWNDLLETPRWKGDVVWVHGDLLPANIILNKTGRLESVIDLSEIGVGDPACDLIIVWALFDKKLRELFKRNIAVDQATWRRGKAWALSIASIMMPYYRTRNKYMYELSLNMISKVLKGS